MDSHRLFAPDAAPRSALAPLASVARLAAAAALVALLAQPAGAQVPNANPRALGMGGNFSAVARGYSAVAWNPAALALPDAPGFTISLLPVTGAAGLSPIGLGHLGPFAGDTVPRAERLRWIGEIEAAGGQEGSGGADLTYLALSIGPVGFQLSTTAHAATSLSPGAAELVLFGNAGRTGVPCTCELDGFSLTGQVVSTGALSFALPVNSNPDSYMTAGVTLKYSVGHAVLHGIDLGSTLTSAPSLELRFPVVVPDTAADPSDIGSGVGVDVGFSFQSGYTTFALAVQNVVHTFAWDETKLGYLPGTALFDRETQEADFDLRPFEGAPAELRQFVADHTFRPRIAGGVAYEATDRLTVAADLRLRLGDAGLDTEPGLHLGAGAEFRLPVLSLQGGGAIVSDGYQIGGGLALDLGPLNLGASVLRRDLGGGTGVVSMVTLLSSGR